MSRRFDAIVIGAGQAGPSMAGRLAASGKTVAIIERGRLGGTCVNVGCTPTKTLVASAYAAHLARRADGLWDQRRSGRRRFLRRHGAQDKNRRRQAQRPRVVAEGHAELHAHRGPRPVRIAPRGRGRGRTDRSGSFLHQCRRARDDPGFSRRRSGSAFSPTRLCSPSTSCPGIW